MENQGRKGRKTSPTQQPAFLLAFRISAQ